MICPTCHGNGLPLLQKHRPCVDCNGSGVAYCCEHYDDILSHEVTHESNMTKIEYYENEHDEDNPRKTGWYINDYRALGEKPYDSVGPYQTKTEALRSWRDGSPKNMKEPSFGPDTEI